MTPEEARAFLLQYANKAIAPCLWHGTTGGPHGPQPANGARFCGQCERRHQRIMVQPEMLLLALDSQPVEE